MADVRFCVGFSKACKQAREGGGLPGYEGRVSRRRALRPFLPPDIVRLIDALVRRLEHEDTLLSMNGGVLGATLCQASAAGGLRDVRFLLARGTDVEHMTAFVKEDGTEGLWTALDWSAHAGMLPVVTALLDAGAGELELALYNAALNGRTPVVALLLDRGADIHYDADGCVIVASQNGRLATATLLLDRGANLHAQDDLSLRKAAEHGHVEVVRLLLDRGANIHADHDYSLRIAAEDGRLETVRLLLDRGADIHALNEYALRKARLNGHAAIVAVLLERGALEPHA